MKEFSTLVKEKKKAEMQRVKLLWSSLSQPKESVPASQLIPDNRDCTPVAVGLSDSLDIVQPGAYTFDFDLPFGATFTVNGQTFNTDPNNNNSFSVLLPAGAIDFQIQMPEISPCSPPWEDTPENEGGPEIEIGVTSPNGERRTGRIEKGWFKKGGGTGNGIEGWPGIDLPSLEPVNPGTNEPPPASPEEPAGTGLYAQHFKGMTFSNLAYGKLVNNVYEDWDYKGPLWDDHWLSDEVRLNVEADKFGIRYTGQIKAMEDGEYKFSFKELDGKARLWVDGQLVMDGEGHGTPPDANNNGIADDVYYGDVSESVSLKAGQKYNFQLDFVDPGGEASAVLHWEKDGGAPGPIWNSLLYPTMPPGMLLVNDEPTSVLVGKSSAAASLLSQYLYDDYESVRVTVRDRSPVESAAFLSMPSGSVLFSETLSKSEVLGRSSYLEIAQKNYGEMFGGDLPERDRLYGTHLAVEYELLDAQGNTVTIDNRVPGRFNDNFYVYRWIDAVGATEAFWGKGATMALHEKIEGSLGKFVTEKEIEFFVPDSMNTTLTGANPDFEYLGALAGSQIAQVNYLGNLPFTGNDEGIVEDVVKIAANGIPVGSLAVKGAPPSKFPLLDKGGKWVLQGNDDNSSVEVPLGFDFNFYGQTYNSFYVNNNGSVTFGEALEEFDPQGFPANLPMIAPFWADVDLQQGGEVSVNQGTTYEGNPYVEVIWENVRYHGAKDNDTKKNNFRLYLENDPEGDWVVLGYDDLQWTTGVKSNGFEGFGGTDALIGLSGGQSGESIVVEQLSSSEALDTIHDGEVLPKTGFVYRIDNEIPTLFSLITPKKWVIDGMRKANSTGMLEFEQPLNNDFVDKMYRVIKDKTVTYNGQDFALRPEVGLFLMSIVSTESSGGTWNANGDGHYGAFQINGGSIQQHLNTLNSRHGGIFPATFNSNTFLNDKNLQLLIAQEHFEEKERLLTPLSLEQIYNDHSYTGRDGSPINLYLPQYAPIYQVAYAWLSLEGEDAHGTKSHDYALAANLNAFKIGDTIKRLRLNELRNSGWKDLFPHNETPTPFLTDS